MTHPTDGELFDLRRGELDEARTMELQAHIEGCARCADLWRELVALESALDRFEEPVPAGGFVARTMDGVRESLWGPPADVHERVPRGSALVRWSRRLAWAAGIVGATLLFQAGVWSPLPAMAIIQPMLSVTGSGGSQAAADSVLVVTVYPGPRFETDILTGRLDRDAFVEALEKQDLKSRFTRVQFMGADADASVELREEDLRPIAEAVGVDHLSFGEGIVAIMEGPLSRGRLDRPVAFNITSTGGEGAEVTTSIYVRGHADSLATYRRAIRIPVEIRTSDEEGDYRAFSIFQAFSDRLILSTVTDSDDARRRTLLVTDQATLTVADDGTLILDRHYLDMAGLEQALRELHRDFPDMGLTLLLPEDGSDLQARLVEIANRIGMPSIRIKKVKK